jgi:hypothetical protein
MADSSTNSRLPAGAGPGTQHRLRWLLIGAVSAPMLAAASRLGTRHRTVAAQWTERGRVRPGRVSDPAGR